MKRSVSKDINNKNLKFIAEKIQDLDYFLGFGTLLGFVRDGETIDLDDDVDICLNKKHRQDVYDLIYHNNLSIIINEPDIIQLGYYIDNNPVIVDFYMFEEKEDYILEKWNFHGQPQNPNTHLHIEKELVYPVKNEYYEDIPIKIPNKPEEMCEYYYGPKYSLKLNKGSDYRVLIENNKPKIVYMNTTINPLMDLGPLYHSYKIFGVDNEQLGGIYGLNQKAKENIILSYISMALEHVRKGGADNISFLDMFCADGYYAMAARKFGYTFALGVDNDRDGFLSYAPHIASRLGIDFCEFVNLDVNELNTLVKHDVVANLGGLYHVENPEEILNKSYNLANKYLIVQTVVSMANEDDSYFESPAPGWSWGCRYSKNSFHKMIVDKGWKILHYHFNELTGNTRLEDRGSCYYLIEKQNSQRRVKK